MGNNRTSFQLENFIPRKNTGRINAAALAGTQHRGNIYHIASRNARLTEIRVSGRDPKKFIIYTLKFLYCSAGAGDKEHVQGRRGATP